MNLPAPEVSRMDIPHSVQHELAKAKIPFSAVTLLVQPVDGSLPRLSFNAQMAFNPASVMKLVTTYAALQELGPDYRWRTELRSRQRPTSSGVLPGDLVIRGRGDPKLDLRHFWQLLQQLRTQGVHEIRGNVLLDRRYFDMAKITADAAQAFDDQPWRSYNALPDALLVNFSSFKVQLESAANSSPSPRHVRATLEPALSDLLVDNQIALDSQASCGNWRSSLRVRLAAAGPQAVLASPAWREERAGPFETSPLRLQLTGTYPEKCGTKSWYLAPLPAAQYTAVLFKQLWLDGGGLWSGRVRLDATANDLEAPLLLAVNESPPLSEIIRDINKYSNNLMARQLFLTLAAQHFPHRPVSPADGLAVVKDILQKNHIQAQDLILENGAGLSRRARISAQTLAQILQQAWQSPLMPEFISSLPLTASDGTLKKRLPQLRYQGHLKTGTLEGVSSLAGYLRNRQGQWQIVVFIVNHPHAAASRAAQDALLNWLWSLQEVSNSVITPSARPPESKIGR